MFLISNHLDTRIAAGVSGRYLNIEQAMVHRNFVYVFLALVNARLYNVEWRAAYSEGERYFYL